MDVDNGILLSPNADSLFDRHLISFTDSGEILISERVSKDELAKLGISLNVSIPISVGMKKYLMEHRKKFDE